MCASPPTAPSERLQISYLPESYRLAEPEQYLRELLLRQPRSLPFARFHDERSTELMRIICTIPEYYPCRVEQALLRRHAAEIVDSAGAEHMIDFGCARLPRIRPLLDEYQRISRPVTYWPFDPSGGHLFASAHDLIADYPELRVQALVGDFRYGPRVLARQHSGSRLLIMLGGKFGNMERAQADAFLAEVRTAMQPGDRLLLAVDRLKPAAVLTAAYNDVHGLIEAFNKNILRVVNRCAGADFSLNRFAHQAVFNQQESRIEMHLEALDAHSVHIGALDHTIELARGERICTEVSHKFTLDALQRVVDAASLRVSQHFEAEQESYSLVLLAPA